MLCPVSSHQTSLHPFKTRLRVHLKRLTLSQPGFFVPKKPIGGGGGTFCAPGKTLLPSLNLFKLRAVFLKAYPKLNLLTHFWFPWKPWLVFEVHRPMSASQKTLSGQKSIQVDKFFRCLDVSNINFIVSR